jgi:CHC2 zinc finger
MTRMLKPILTPRDIVERYHRSLPEEINAYLKDHGIPATVIDRQLLGWNGERITIPVFAYSTREVLGFRYAKSPFDESRAPEIVGDENLGPQLYGWETLARRPHRIVVCDGELQRLVLEARGFPAVTSTAGADVFLEEWADHFTDIGHVFVCFNRSAAGDAAAQKVQQVLPSARTAKLPAEVGVEGTVSDFFVGLDRTPLDFEIVLAGATANGGRSDRPPAVREFRAVHPALQRRAERVQAAVPLHEVAGRFTHLQAEGSSLAGHCPFHDDSSRSFRVYPEAGTYTCSVCGAEGDVVKFLMDKESMTFGQALEALERYQFTHDLNATS